MVSYDGNLTITGSADVFDTIANATQIEITGLSLLDGHRTVTVYPDTNSIVFASYHSKGATTYLIDPETGQYLIDPETGDFIIASEGGIPPGDYTVTIIAIIGITYESSCTITVAAGTFCRECQDTANAAALASAQSQAEECIEEDPSILYRNSDIEYTATCPAGQYGEYTATVTYNTYTSTVSQQDADQKALNAAIFEAISQIECVVPPACQWFETDLFDEGTTTSESGSLENSGDSITGTATATVTSGRYEFFKKFEFYHIGAAISIDVEFDVTVLSPVSGLTGVYSGCGCAMYFNEVLEDDISIRTDNSSTGTQTKSFSLPETSVPIKVWLDFGCGVVNPSGTPYSGNCSFTATIENLPCTA